MNPTQKQFSLNCGASRKQIPISKAREALNQRAAVLGMPQPVPAGLSPASPDIIAAITQSEKEQFTRDKAVSAAEVATAVFGAEFKAKQDALHGMARERANLNPGAIPPNIPLGYPEGDAELVRYFEDKDKESQSRIREREEEFFRDAVVLVPLEFQHLVTDSEGHITKAGRAFLRAHVRMKDRDVFDDLTQKHTLARRLTFVNPLPEPLGAVGAVEEKVGGTWNIGEPMPGMDKDGNEIPMRLPPIIETPKRLLPIGKPRLRTQFRDFGIQEDFIPSNTRDVRDMEDALDMGIRKNRYQKYITR